MNWIVLLAVLAAALLMLAAEPAGPAGAEATLKLPEPDRKGKVPLETALAKRRSVRRYAQGELTMAEVSQLCWAACGVNRPRGGYRTSPSAGALYPLELYVVMPTGVYRYDVRKHTLLRQVEGDQRGPLAAAALDQGCVRSAPVCFVIVAEQGRSAVKYGKRAWRYCLLEAGHVAQNILLQVTTLGLGAVPVGACDDDRVGKVLRLPDGQQPVYIIPVGRIEKSD